jgi:hypothetical protein
VQVAGTAVSNGFVLEIEDRGLGMSDEELIQANERLTNPPAVDFSLSRMLGLYVVGRLAQRYNVKVQLRHSWYGGITALVMLPRNLITGDPGVQLPAAADKRSRGALALPPSGQPTPTPQAAANDGGIAADDTRVAADDLQDDATLAEAAGPRLPIFEAARSDWFEDPAHAQPPRHPGGGWPNGGAGPAVTEDAGHLGGLADAPLPRRPRPAPQDLPARRRRFDEPAAAPLAEPAPASAETPWPAPPPPPPSPLQPSSMPLTRAGLPRRIPQANLAPGMVTAPATAAGAGEPPEAAASAPAPPQAAASAPAPTGLTRSPEEVRSLLTSYRSGLQRGRLMAAGEGADEGHHHADPSARSDDDAPQ